MSAANTASARQPPARRSIVRARTWTSRDRQRQHAGNERDRRHQNRPQAISIRANDRFEPFHAARTQLIRVIDLQNRVLLHHAKQQQQPESRKNVHRLAGHQQRKNAERNRERQCQQNRYRVNERLKLRRQHHVHEDERKNERQHEVITCATELLRTSRQAG